MSDPRAVLLYGCAPLPRVNRPVDEFQAYFELSVLHEEVKGSQFAVELRGLPVRSADSLYDLIRPTGRQLFIHLCLPADRLNACEDNGDLSSLDLPDLVQPLLERDLALLVVTGPASSDLAFEFARLVTHPTPVVYQVSDDNVDDGTRKRFFETFYRRLLRDDSEVTVEEAFNDAQRKASRGRAENERYGYLPAEIGSRLISTEPSKSVNNDFLRLLQASQSRPIFGRDDEIRDLGARLSAPQTEHQAHIVGATLSGKTAFLKAAERFAVQFELESAYIDMNDFSSQAEVYASLEHRFADPAGLSLPGLLAEHSMLLRVDNFRHSRGSELLRLFKDLPPHATSRLVAAWAGNVDDPPHGPPIRLRMFDSEQSTEFLRQRAPGIFKGRSRRRVIAPSLPGVLVSILQDLADGNTDPRDADFSVTARIPSVEDAIARLAQDPEIRTVLFAFALLGRSVPRTILRDTFRALNVGRDDTDGTALTASLRSLLSAGFVTPRELRSRPADLTELTEQHWVIESAALKAAQHLMHTELPQDYDRAGLKAAVERAVQLSKEFRLNNDQDVIWLDSLARNLQRAGMFSEACELAHPLVWSQNGALRRRGTPDQAAEVLRVLVECAELADEPSLSGQCGLILGERLYVSGRHDEADAAFERAIENSTLDDTLIRALRARGQVAYRRAEWDRALALYEQAQQHTSDAKPGFRATLATQHAKALMRTGAFVKAAALLDLAHAIYSDELDDRGMRRVEHEQARMLEASRPDLRDEARQWYTQILTGARMDNDTRLICAPSYQLCLLELREYEETKDSRALKAAGKHARACSKHAQSIRDELWICLSDLARGFVASAQGRSIEASNLIVAAGALAKERRFGQAEVDAKAWTRGTRLPPAFAYLKSDVAAAPTDDIGSLPLAKRAKAVEYATEPWRIRNLAVSFESTTETRSLHAGAAERWRCDCNLFNSSGSCTHVFAARRILDYWPPYEVGAQADTRQATARSIEPEDE